MLAHVMARAPLKMSIFQLSKTVTHYDEKPDNESFANQVKEGLKVVSSELHRFTTFINEPGSEDNKESKGVQTEFEFGIKRSLIPRKQLPDYSTLQ